MTMGLGHDEDRDAEQAVPLLATETDAFRASVRLTCFQMFLQTFCTTVIIPSLLPYVTQVISRAIFWLI